MPIFGPKCQFWAKFGRFWAPNPIFWGQGVKILVPSYRDSNETPFSCWKHWSVGLKLAARGENVLFWPQNLDIWGQKSIFCLVIAIFVDGTNDHFTRGYNFPSRTTPKKISVSLTCTALPRSDTDIQTFLFLHIQSTAFLPLGFAPAWLRWTTTWTLTGNFRSVLSMALHYWTISKYSFEDSTHLTYLLFSQAAGQE